MKLKLHVLLISALRKGECSALCCSHFTPVERVSGTYQFGDWVDFGAALDVISKRKILPLLGIKP
jgi:hypothetical protein